MAEYIKREDVLQHKRKMRCADFRGGFWDFIVRCEDIERIPAAEVVEVRHGVWVQGDYYDIGDVCSECDFDSNVDHCCWRYCPNCGAKMDGKGEDNDG